MLSSVKNQTSCTSVDTVNNGAQALALLDAGLSVKDVAKQLGVVKATHYSIRRNYKCKILC